MLASFFGLSLLHILIGANMQRTNTSFKPESLLASIASSLAVSLMLVSFAAAAATPTVESAKSTAQAVPAAPSPTRAQEIVAPVTTFATPSQAESLETRLLKLEAKHLRERNDSIESYHESVLTTSYFALGAVLTMTVLLLGYSWWFNTKAYESDKTALRNELETKIAGAGSSIALREQEQRSAAEAAFNARIDSVNAANAATSNQMRSELTAVRESSEKALAEPLLKIGSLYREFRMLEEMVWDQQGVHSNSLLSLAQGLDLCVDDKDDAFFDLVAARFKRRIGELLESKYVLADDSRGAVERKLAKSLERRRDKTQEILDLLAQIARPAKKAPDPEA